MNSTNAKLVLDVLLQTVILLITGCVERDEFYVERGFGKWGLAAR